MSMLESYLAGKYGRGCRTVSWKALNKDILPGYEPGRIDLPGSRRSALNSELETLALSGYITLKKYKSERSFTLYSVVFTAKMEDLCRLYGIRTKKMLADDVTAVLEQARVTSVPLKAWKEDQLRRVMEGSPDAVFWSRGISRLEMIRAVTIADAILLNKENIYIRDISKRVLGNSKAFRGNVKTKACALLKLCSEPGILEEFEDVKKRLGKNTSILTMYHVLSTPDYVFSCGSMEICTPDGEFSFHSMPYVFSSDAMERYTGIKILTENFITIENKTTYEDFDEEGFTKFFTGGFPGYTEKEILLKIYKDNPGVHFYHWGDIDAGGFRIFNNIKMYVPSVRPFNMDVCDLIKYDAYTDTLTENDRKALSVFTTGEFSETAKYMLKNNVKLEQESLYA